MKTFEDLINFKNAKSMISTKIQDNQNTLNSLLSIENKTYQNFVSPYEKMEEELSIMITPIFHLDSVKNSEETQKLYSELLPLLSEYSNNLAQNIDLFEGFKEVSKNDTNMTISQQKVVNDSIKGFKLSGCELSQEKKDRLKEISLKSSQLSKDFSQNVLNATNEYAMIIENPEDVKGIPQSDLEIASFEEEGKTKYKFTLQMPSYISYMTYGPNRKIRETLYKEFSTRAPQNELIIEELLKLREEKSSILGFDSYSEYSIAKKSAPSVEKVIDFLENLGEKSKDKAKEELNELKVWAQSDKVVIKQDNIQPWDIAYYSETLREEMYSLNEEEYRPYLEQSQVVNGLFDFIHDLWKVEFRKIEEPVWNNKVKVFELFQNNEKIAKLYLDLEARENKRGGAWMNNWHSKLPKQIPTAYVVCNFPQSTEKTPSLLRHGDVVTLFHEMGHALHHLLTKIEEPSVGGVNVDWDVVEFPSQFLEYFAYETNVLQMFAKHYQTGEVLPSNMINKIIKAKNYHSAMTTIRQVEFALFDFKLHLDIHNKEEMQNLLDNIREKYSPLLPPSYNKFQNSFTHIFAGGYAAGYYSYKWAEVLSASAFVKYLESEDKEKYTITYRDIINGKGGSEEMNCLFHELTGEDPDVEKLLKIDGII